jgi:hypothetical protein
VQAPLPPVPLLHELLGLLLASLNDRKRGRTQSHRAGEGRGEEIESEPGVFAVPQGRLMFLVTSTTLDADLELFSYTVPEVTVCMEPENECWADE